MTVLYLVSAVTFLAMEDDFCGPPFNQAHLFEGASPEVKAGIVEQLNDIDGKLPGATMPVEKRMNPVAP